MMFHVPKHHQKKCVAIPHLTVRKIFQVQDLEDPVQLLRVERGPSQRWEPDTGAGQRCSAHGFCLDFGLLNWRVSKMSHDMNYLFEKQHCFFKQLEATEFSFLFGIRDQVVHRNSSKEGHPTWHWSSANDSSQRIFKLSTWVLHSLTNKPWLSSWKAKERQCLPTSQNWPGGDGPSQTTLRAVPRRTSSLAGAELWNRDDVDPHVTKKIIEALRYLKYSEMFFWFFCFWTWEAFASPTFEKQVKVSMCPPPRKRMNLHDITWVVEVANVDPTDDTDCFHSLGAATSRALLSDWLHAQMFCLLPFCCIS